MIPGGSEPPSQSHLSLFVTGTNGRERGSNKRCPHGAVFSEGKNFKGQITDG